jgi:hypothetical protein
MTYTSSECTVETLDDGQRNCPKHVEFLDKNKFGKISASVGFIKKKFITMQGHMNVKLIYPCNFKKLIMYSSKVKLSTSEFLTFACNIRTMAVKLAEFPSQVCVCVCVCVCVFVACFVCDHWKYGSGFRHRSVNFKNLRNVARRKF